MCALPGYVAYIYYKYAEAGGRLRMIEELMRALIEKWGMANKMKESFIKSRKGLMIRVLYFITWSKELVN